MSTEDNKAVVRRYVEELQNNGDLDVADEIIHPNPRNPRSVSMWSNGPESVKQTVSGVRKSFPDLHRQIDDMVAEGDKVVLYSTISGTYAGPSEGYPFLVWKDEKINMTVVATFMVEDGKMIEEPWSKWNRDEVFGPLAIATVRHWIEEVWNKGDLAVAENLTTADYAYHDPATPFVSGDLEGVKNLVTLSRSAFPDLYSRVDDIDFAGDRVFTRWTATGTHEGELLGTAPTGNQISMAGISIYRISEGKIAEEWKNWDALGLMQQIGVVPPVGEPE